MKCQNCNLENGKRTRITRADGGVTMICPECLVRGRHRQVQKAQPHRRPQYKGPGRIFATVSGPRMNPRNRHMHRHHSAAH